MPYGLLPSLAGTYDILPVPASLSAYPDFFLKLQKSDDIKRTYLRQGQPHYYD